MRRLYHKVLSLKKLDYYHIFISNLKVITKDGFLLVDSVKCFILKVCQNVLYCKCVRIILFFYSIVSYYDSDGLADCRICNPFFVLVIGRQEIQTVLPSDANCGVIFGHGCWGWSSRAIYYTCIANNFASVSLLARCYQQPSSSDSKEPWGTRRNTSSRLRYVDQQLRKQKALQHLGVIMRQAWRPQTGLPENSVSRAWLFEHLLNP